MGVKRSCDYSGTEALLVWVCAQIKAEPRDVPSTERKIRLEEVKTIYRIKVSKK